MNATETSIVNKLTAEIEAATGEDRSQLITDLWTVMCATEKRVALETQSLAAKLTEEAKTALGAVRVEARKVAGEIEARL